jgi:hypothetical protein
MASIDNKNDEVNTEYDEVNNSTEYNEKNSNITVCNNICILSTIIMSITIYPTNYHFYSIEKNDDPILYYKTFENVIQFFEDRMDACRIFVIDCESDTEIMILIGDNVFTIKTYMFEIHT